ncbi:hypothetical protein [Klebsiella phage phiKp_21]|nr:hypothetical protein [Klebsiella phage phiKp_21]
MPAKSNKEEFIKKANLIHKNIDFSDIEYNGSLELIYPKCNGCDNIIETTPNRILSGRGCKKCFDKSLQLTNSEYDLKLQKLYGDKFVRITDYNGNRKHVEFNCIEHNKKFKVLACTSLYGEMGCDYCNTKDGRKRKVTTKQFILQIKSIKKFENYDFSSHEYINRKTKSVVKCEYKHTFEATPSSLLSKRGCPICALRTTTSKAMYDIIDILNKNKIEFIREKTFDNCKNVHKLPFDLYLPTYNIIIEYDGKQHFEIFEHWGGEKKFNQRQTNDKIKTEYCISNNITLFRIRYDEDHIQYMSNIIKGIK